MKVAGVSLGLRRGEGRLYYGWVMLLAVSLAQVTAWGILSDGFSVFISPLRDEFGWSLAQTTGAYSLGLAVSGLAAIPVGRWLDRRGPRGLMTFGSCLAVLLVVAWSRVQSLLGFYLLWAGLGVAMAMVLYEPAFFIVATWFARLRGRALTLLTFVGGLASVIFIPLAGWLLGRGDWRTALLVLAGILAAITIPIHACVLRRHPSDLGLEVDGGAAAPGSRVAPEVPSRTLAEALRDRAFWWLSSAFVLATTAAMAVTVHLIPYLKEHGYSTSSAAQVAGAIGLLALPGRLIFTPLGSHVPRQYVTCAIFVLQACALVVLLEVHGGLGVALFVVLFGCGFGAITPARAALVAEMYGPRHYGSIGGTLALCVTGARSIAPVGAGVLYGMLGGYRAVFWTLVVLSALAALAALGAHSPLTHAQSKPEPELST
jgi:MFS family permease